MLELVGWPLGLARQQQQQQQQHREGCMAPWIAFEELSLDVFAGDRAATHAEVAMFQAGIGSRLLLSGSTRVDLAADVSLLESCLQNMMYSNLVDLNKTVRKAKRGSVLSVLPAAQRASSQRHFYR